MTAQDLTVHLEHRVDPRCTRRLAGPPPASAQGTGHPALAPVSTEPRPWLDREFTD